MQNKGRAEGPHSNSRGARLLARGPSGLSFRFPLLPSIELYYMYGFVCYAFVPMGLIYIDLYLWSNKAKGAYF